MSRRDRILAALFVLAGVAALVGVPTPAQDPPPPPRDPAPIEPPEPPEPPGRYRSPIAVCLSPNGERAYVVNQTGNSVSVLDLSARKVVGEIAIGANPTHAVLSPQGERLYVTSRHGHRVEVIDTAQRRVVRSLRTGYEPYGVALAPIQRRLFVANSLSNTVSIIDLESGETLHEVPVGERPRYLSLTPDGKRLLVTNSLSRDLTIVATASGRVIETRRLGKSSLLREVVTTADGRWGLVAHVLSHDEEITLQMERGWIHSNGFSVLDLDRPGHYVTLLLDRLTAGAANPWGAAVSPDGRRLYVTLAGVHELAIVDLPAALRLADTDAVERMGEDVEVMERLGIARRVPTGGLGPRGLALDSQRGELIVANHFSDSVTVLDAASGELRATIPLGPPQELTPWRQGELLFNDARLCYQTWFSCASCHEEDASADGLNWDLPNDGMGNSKNAKSLRNIHDSPPAMWTGARADMSAAVAAGQRFLGFLPEPGNHRALLAFLGSPRRPPNPYRLEDPAAQRRGERIFRRARCHSCHPPPTFGDGLPHDLGLANPTDLRTAFDTPSLREVYRTAPYLHDGRAPTLRDVFSTHNPSDHHGRTSALTPSQLDDLIAYLRSL